MEQGRALTALQVQGALLVLLAMVSFYWIHRSGDARDSFAPREKWNAKVTEPGRLETPEIQFPIDLNRATAAQLEALPGIGPALAKRILAYRAEHGAFKTVRTLDAVSGIGPKVYARIAPLIVIESAPLERVALPSERNPAGDVERIRKR